MPQRSPLHIAVDAGGTSCRVWVMSAGGDILGKAVGTGINATRGAAAFLDRMLANVTRALTDSGEKETALHTAVAGIGLAGFNHAPTREKVCALRFPFAETYLTTDVHIACLGAHNGRDGAVIILGTGSCGLLLRKGQQHSIGGWGFPVSDSASGAWLGLEAVRRALLEYDAMAAKSAMGERILAHFDRQPDRIVDWMLAATGRDYAEMASYVVHYAEQQDPAAVSILQRAAADLTAMISRLQAMGAERVALLGGLATALTSHLTKEQQQVLTPPARDALAGAAILLSPSHSATSGVVHLTAQQPHA